MAKISPFKIPILNKDYRGKEGLFVEISQDDVKGAIEKKREVLTYMENFFDPRDEAEEILVSLIHGFRHVIENPLPKKLVEEFGKWAHFVDYNTCTPSKQ